MRVVSCRDYAAPLAIEDRESPRAGERHVIVEVAAAGLNYVDDLIVKGEYQIKPPVPFVPGSEVAGTVVEVGEGVDGFAMGDRVFAMTGFGGFAERVAIAEAALLRVPESMTFGQAASFTQSYSTALFALRDRACMQKGEQLLVLGAAGGVGRAAIDVGKALGLRVLAAASTDAKLDACRDMGADALIRYADEDLKTRARELSDGGVDGVLDPVGGELAEPALRAMGFRGRFIVIGFAGGPIPRIPLNQVLLRNRSVVGVDWGAWMFGHPQEQRALIEELVAMVADGTLHPSEPTVYPMQEVTRALEDLRERRVNGKAVVVP